MIRVFECFAGYGTTTFALKQLGIEHELVGFSEIDKYAIQCFQQNHSGKNFGDITKINWSEVSDFDLLTGGFPCQAFSTAGKQLGEQDHRGQLGLELTRALKEKQPKYFLFENVKGFMSKKFEETRNKFIESWREAGYNVQFKVLNTKDFGVPQNRERVWFVGIRRDIQQEFKFPESFELKLKLKDILEDNVDEKYYLKDQQVTKMLGYFKNKEISSAIRTACKQISFNRPSGEIIELTEKQSKGNRVYSPEGSSPALSALGGGLGAKTGLYWLQNSGNIKNQNGSGVKSGDAAGYTLTARDKHGFMEIKDISASITTENAHSFGKNVTPKQAAGVGLNTGIIRRLTPKECFRLQGFLKDQINLEGLSDTQKYKLAGNGQSVNVVKLLLKQLVLNIS